MLNNARTAVSGIIQLSFSDPTITAAYHLRHPDSRPQVQPDRLWGTFARRPRTHIV